MRAVYERPGCSARGSSAARKSCTSRRLVERRASACTSPSTLTGAGVALYGLALEGASAAALVKRLRG